MQKQNSKVKIGEALITMGVLDIDALTKMLDKQIKAAGLDKKQ